jgi:hypothetical protein
MRASVRIPADNRSPELIIFCWIWDFRNGDYPLACDAVKSGINLTFYRNPLYSLLGSLKLCFLLDDSLLGLLFHSEDGGTTFLRTVRDILDCIWSEYGTLICVPTRYDYRSLLFEIWGSENGHFLDVTACSLVERYNVLEDSTDSIFMVCLHSCGENGNQHLISFILITLIISSDEWARG